MNEAKKLVRSLSGLLAVIIFVLPGTLVVWGAMSIFTQQPNWYDYTDWTIVAILSVFTSILNLTLGLWISSNLAQRGWLNKSLDLFSNQPANLDTCFLAWIEVARSTSGEIYANSKGGFSYLSQMAFALVCLNTFGWICLATINTIVR